MRVLIIGCGYVGMETGRGLVRQGHEVYGIRRSVDRSMAGYGIHPIIGDITKPSFWEHLSPEFGWVINCVSSSRGNAEVYRDVYLNTTRCLMHWLHHTGIDRYVYTSSTSVLGMKDGSTVDESTPVAPATEAARILVETEECLFEAARSGSVPAVILRLSGIYGPERGYLFRKYVAGEAEMTDPSRYMNMIHRDDAAEAIIAACHHGNPGEVYHITDDKPVTQQEFFEYLSSELRKPMPPAAGETDNKAGTPRKRAPTSKRISNLKAREHLQWQPAYPSWKEGFAAEIAAIHKKPGDD